MADEKARVDPVLLEQLEGAALTGGLVEAVVFLRQPGVLAKGEESMRPADPLPPKRVDVLAEDLLERAAEASGSKPEVVNVFRNLGSFVVSAEASFVRALIDQPEVSSAAANRQPDVEE